MEMMDLPRFIIPTLTRKKISPEVYDEWNNFNAQFLAKIGMREKRRQDPTRVPVSERFVMQ